MKKILLFLLLFTSICYCQDVIPPQYTSDYSTEEAAAKPHLTIEYKGKTLGFVKGYILAFEEGKSKWDTIMATPLYIASAAIIRDSLIITNSLPLQLYSVDLINKKTIPYNLPEQVFAEKKAIKFTVELGSSGCFHHDIKSRNYKLKRNYFKTYSKKGKQKCFRGMGNSIGTDFLQDIVNEADLSRSESVTFKEIDITKNDINVFKKMLDTLKITYYDSSNIYCFKKDIDLNFYRALADSLDRIQNDVINNTLKKECEIISTANIWHLLTIEFEDGSKVTIENSDYIPGYYYTPWVINYNGLIFETSSVKLGKMIDRLTGGKFLDDKYKDKKYAIYKITDYMYNLSVNKE
jgi:hypothetical protein